MPGFERYVLEGHVRPIVIGKVQVAGDRKKTIGSQQQPKASPTSFRANECVPYLLLKKRYRPLAEGLMMPVSAGILRPNNLDYHTCYSDRKT